MFGGSHGFGSERGNTVGVSYLGHTERERPHRNDLDAGRERDEAGSEGVPLLISPGTGQGAAGSGNHAAAQPV
jgi:hypothetical protein